MSCIDGAVSFCLSSSVCSDARVKPVSLIPLLGANTRGCRICVHRKLQIDLDFVVF
jgi:hypothetical protein